MRIQIKKLSLALIALGLSGVANAAMYFAPPSPVLPVTSNVIVPCEGVGWRIGFTGMFLEQTSDHTDFSGIDAYAFTFTSGVDNLSLFDINGRYRFGFKLEAAYDWSQGHELALSWKRVQGDTQDDTITHPATLDPIVGALLFTPYDEDLFSTLPSPFVIPITSITTHADFDFDQVNVDLGQYVNFGDYVNTRFHFGLSYLNIDHDVDTVILGTTPTTGSIIPVYTGDFEAAVADDSRFSGVGIRTGVNANWNFYKGNVVRLGIVGEANAGLYAGNLKNNVEAVIVERVTPTPDEDEVTFSGNFRAHYESDRTIVPEAEGKLGLGLTYLMGDSGRVEVDGGWEAQGVFNSIKHVGFVNNYGHQGPFVQLQYIA